MVGVDYRETEVSQPPLPPGPYCRQGKLRASAESLCLSSLPSAPTSVSSSNIARLGLSIPAPLGAPTNGHLLGPGPLEESQTVWCLLGWQLRGKKHQINTNRKGLVLPLVPSTAETGRANPAEIMGSGFSVKTWPMLEGPGPKLRWQAPALVWARGQKNLGSWTRNVNGSELAGMLLTGQKSKSWHITTVSSSHTQGPLSISCWVPL